MLAKKRRTLWVKNACVVCRWGLDSGLVVVIFITTVYLLLVFGLFFYVKNEWCYVLFKNFTVRKGSVLENMKKI